MILLFDLILLLLSYYCTMVLFQAVNVHYLLNTQFEQLLSAYCSFHFCSCDLCILIIVFFQLFAFISKFWDVVGTSILIFA
jgi:hypothetical protein